MLYNRTLGADKYCLRQKISKSKINAKSLGRLVRLHQVYESMKVKVIQSCLTVCDPMDYTVHGILQARILGWVAFHSSRIFSQPRVQIQISCIAGEFFTS